MPGARLRALLRTILIASAIGYAAVVIGMYFAQRGLLYPGASGSFVERPAVAPWGAWASIATADGEMLSALHSRVLEQKATFLFFHGNADDIAGYGFLADALSSAGYGLLAVSFRGFSGSTGSPTETGLLEDGRAAFDWLAAQGPTAPIVLLGRSLGTGVAIGTAAERDAAALILVSPYASIAAVAGAKYPLLPVSLLIKDPFRSDQRIDQVSEPKLFLHGDRDGLIPLSSGQALFDTAPEPKHFSVQTGRGHNDIWTQSLINEAVRFADEILAAGPAG